HRFNAGNSNTLSKVTQETLKKFYYDNYSGHLMHLIVYSPLPIEELKKLVVEDFKDVPTNNNTPLNPTVPLFSEGIKQNMIVVSAIKDTRTLNLMWEVPARFAHMKKTQPDTILCHVLGYEGPGSLLAELKEENLAEELNCSHHKWSPDQLLISITI